MSTKIQNQKGLTLIETLVYIALFSIIIFGALVAAFNLIEGSDKLGHKNVLQSEANFVLRKIDWALAGAQNFTINSSLCADSLTITKSAFSENPIVIDIAGDKIRMRDGASNPLPLTTENVSVFCLSFTEIPASGNAPKGVTIKIIMDNLIFETSKYLR